MSGVNVQTLHASSLRLNAGMQVVRPVKHPRKHGIKGNVTQVVEKPRKPRKLDGFLMLEACRVELPAEAVRAHLADQVLIAVAVEDMKYFACLEWIDAGENQLKLEMFSTLPNLRELRLQYNRISQVPQLDGLQALQKLDLSYNHLDAESIQNLSSLGALRELDLSGNQLNYLPDMNEFLLLERLTVEYNCFAHEDALCDLAFLPRLRELSFAHNRLRGVQIPSTSTRRRFPALELLDLAYNKIVFSDSLSTLIPLQRLRSVFVYGNPLCGPTGEDPTKFCVEELVIASIEMNKSPGNTLRFVTEVPRKKQRRWNRDPGRQAFYQHVDMKHVASFEETLVNAAEDEVGSEPFSKYVENLTLGVPDPKPTGTFMTGMDLPVERQTNAMFDLRRNIESTVQRATNKATNNTSLTPNSPQLDELDDAENIPERLLHPGFDQAVGYGDARPKALQQAMKELRYTLSHPLEPSGSLPYYGSHLVPFLQPTALTIIRQRTPRQQDADNTDSANYAASALLNTTQSATAQTWSSSNRQPDFRRLRQIEQALDSLNRATTQAAERVAADILNGDRQLAEAPLAAPSLQDKVQGIGDVLAQAIEDAND